MSQYFILPNESIGEAAVFAPFPDEVGLPFPLNQSPEVKCFLVLLLTLILILGINIRSKILRFLWNSENQKNPINYFFWFDQSRGIFSGLNIIFTIVATVVPFPICNIIGYELCNWADFFGSAYLIGSTVWSCNMALFRQIKLIIF